MPRGNVFGGKAHGLRLERMRASSRYREGVFHNTAPVSPGLKPGTAFSTMGEYMLGGQRRTPPAPLPVHSPLATWARPVDTGLRATWLGHSTVLLEIDGLRVLTDPVWGERASPYAFAGPKRFHPVPVTLAQLPPLDAVILSHDHYDHLDYPTILRLGRGQRVRLVMPRLGTPVEPARAEPVEPWWQSVGARDTQRPVAVDPAS